MYRIIYNAPSTRTLPVLPNLCKCIAEGLPVISARVVDDIQLIRERLCA